MSGEKEENQEANSSPKKKKARLEDTALEKKIFGILAHGFGLANPRTLKRLHNCFRLIKALEFYKTSLTDQGFYPRIKTFLGLSEVVDKTEEDCYKELCLKIQPFLLPWSEKVEQENNSKKDAHSATGPQPK